ncbi:unnamed protein product [Hydatigera taeniaeformis]|uniref:DUF4806 domain-containing protein n=1 Tax=Hydatigena taeniaeformis TaxID=6205 RepID=A0A0R3WUN5_HYDTA|nr:unnamed protein product [Hydatigera taeniaeformis]
MFIVNRCGRVGAFYALAVLTIVVPEALEDRKPTYPYLRVSDWVYPLDRSCSFIYCWAKNRMIIQEPYSHIWHPRYIVVRLPNLITDQEASVVWNYLDNLAQVKGKFNCAPQPITSSLHNEGLKPIDECKLDNAPPNTDSGDLKVVKPRNTSKTGCEDQPCSLSAVPLSVALRPTKDSRASQKKVETKMPESGRRKGHKIVSSSQTKFEPKTSDPEGNPNKNASHFSRCLKELMEGCVAGSSTKEFIEIIINPRSIKISCYMAVAVRITFNELSIKKSQREMTGMPSPFDFGEASLAASASLIRNHRLRNLISAAEYFDEKLNNKQFIFVQLEPSPKKLTLMRPCKMPHPLTACPVTAKLMCCHPPLDVLLVATVSKRRYLKEMTCLDEFRRYNPHQDPAKADFNSC